MFLVFPVVLEAWIGHGLAFIDAQRLWERSLAPLGPLGGLVPGDRRGRRRGALLAMAMLLLAIVAWRELGAPYGLYAIAALAIPMALPSERLGGLYSFPRFALAAFPCLVALAVLARDRRVHGVVARGSLCGSRGRRGSMGAVVLGRLTEVPRSRLLGWTILVTVLAALSYAANLAGGDPPKDVLYQWTTAVGGCDPVRDHPRRRAPALRAASRRRPSACGRPPRGHVPSAGSRRRLVMIWVIGAILNVFLKAGEEQGLVPDGWDSSRAAPFVANFIVVAVVAPFVEELTYRGLGFAAVRDAHGAAAAIVVTALAFGLAHGLVVALPVLSIFGAILAWLRLRTESVYPTMILHALFNGIALIAAVTV